MSTSTITAHQHTPSRSLAQRLDALNRANAVRVERAEFKRQAKAKPKDAAARRAAEVILDPPHWMQTMKVYDLLMTVPRVGRTKANKLINVVRVSPSKTLGGLSDRQRRELAKLICPETT